jgi:hypothetical protein
MQVGTCKQFPLVLHRRPRTSATAAKFLQDETVCGSTQVTVSKILVRSYCTFFGVLE